MNTLARATFLTLAFALAACGNPNNGRLQGWIEGDFVFVGPDEMGRVETLNVREGDQVMTGAPLFAVDADLQQSDLQMQEAAVTNARQAYDRAVALIKTSAGTQKALEDAEATLRTAKARLNSSQTRLARRKLASPVSGAVQQIYYRPGEMVPAGRPVLSILPPGNIKVRFFIGEPLLPTIALGDTVEVTCDGCARPASARVSFIARAAEYTPPVIYSLEERNKLVFMIEARTETPDGLRVGQPVSVALAGRTAEARK
jgi:HlyD family secretion protein